MRRKSAVLWSALDQLRLLLLLLVVVLLLLLVLVQQWWRWLVVTIVLVLVLLVVDEVRMQLVSQRLMFVLWLVGQRRLVHSVGEMRSAAPAFVFAATIVACFYFVAVAAHSVAVFASATADSLLAAPPHALERLPRTRLLAAQELHRVHELSVDLILLVEHCEHFAVQLDSSLLLLLLSRGRLSQSVARAVALVQRLWLHMMQLHGRVRYAIALTALTAASGEGRSDGIARNAHSARNNSIAATNTNTDTRASATTASHAMCTLNAAIIIVVTTELVAAPHHELADGRVAVDVVHVVFACGTQEALERDVVEQLQVREQAAERVFVGC